MKHIVPTFANVKTSPTLLGACMEDVNHELYGGIWSQMIFGEAFEEPEGEDKNGVSSMWLPVCGTGFSLDDGGFSGSHRQTLTDSAIMNRGLNRSGMYFAKEKPYRGFVIASSDNGAKVSVSLRNADGTVSYSETTFTVEGEFAKYPFTLISTAEETDGAFVISADGTASFGYVFLEPDEWGLYKGLHVRRDVGEALENMGIGLLRFGGCMANARDYLWKNMTGEPENRRPYKGWWYPYSSYGFGVLEFIELCEKLNVTCVPDFNGMESGEDMRDFAQYALGTDETNEWVRLRMNSHHPEPYHLEYIQYGNEETVTEDFATRFIAACEGVWSVSRDVTMVIGDFDYHGHPFDDPYNIPAECVPTAYNVEPGEPPKRVTTLAEHGRILEYAKSVGMAGKVLVDIHWWCEHGDTPLPFPECAWSFHRHLENIAPNSGVKLAVYELNANAHDFERGMANAYAIIEAVNHCDILPFMSSANCLQVDGHNDNGWNQGLLFMNNRSVWYQAAGCVDIMLRRALLERKFEFAKPFADNTFNAAATTDGEKISVIMVNRAEEPVDVCIEIPFDGVYKYELTVMTYPKSECNTATEPDKIRVPSPTAHEHSGSLVLTLAGNSIVAVGAVSVGRLNRRT